MVVLSLQPLTRITTRGKREKRKKFIDTEETKKTSKKYLSDRV